MAEFEMLKLMLNSISSWRKKEKFLQFRLRTEAEGHKKTDAKNLVSSL
jgi:hypothetical protein